MKILKWIGILLVFVMMSTIGCGVALSKKMPPTVDQDADALADLMLKNLNVDAWDTLNYLQWTFFRGEHHYKWNKAANIANIQWKGYEVRLDLDSVSGVAYKDGVKLTGEEYQKAVDKAWSIWCNDSFWMFAPFKVYDEGVSREVVQTDEAPHGLKITYGSGGVTPGDTYVWLLDESYRPIAWRMYVGILPIKGLYTDWSGWKSIDGAMLSTTHVSSLMTMAISNVKGGNSIESIDYDVNTFTLQ